MDPWEIQKSNGGHWEVNHENILKSCDSLSIFINSPPGDVKMFQDPGGFQRETFVQGQVELTGTM